ncbi:hypothetical protein, partial [Clostridium perfringens]|uniref:hypothetical protein n=1 Tax=Clostridium perfringens TaxID=1502 RepID=UPI0039EC0A1E
MFKSSSNLFKDFVTVLELPILLETLVQALVKAAFAIFNNNPTSSMSSLFLNTFYSLYLHPLMYKIIYL